MSKTEVLVGEKNSAVMLLHVAVCCYQTSRRGSSAGAQQDLTMGRFCQNKYKETLVSIIVERDDQLC